MISSFHIGNFKSYRDAHLPLAPLTLLIGANASGKSNAIEAIRLLSMLADGRRLDDVISDIQSSEEVIRGSSLDLPRDRNVPVVVGCELESDEWNRLKLAIRVDEDGAEIVEEVVMDRAGRVRYQTEQATKWAVFPLFDSIPSHPDPAVSVIRKAGAEFRWNLERVLFFDPQPRRMRGYSFSGERVLKEDGSNVSAVLLDLHSKLGSERLLEFVAVLPEQPFVKIAFIETDRRDVMVRLTESYGHSEEVRDAPVLSDGTLRVLGIAAALFSAEPGSTIVIEEIDNGVHPSRAETLLRNIERVAKERDLRVLLTTHNPALLDRLPTDAIPHVVCAYRDPDEGDSRLVRLEDLPSYPELIARGPLGQLMTRGVLDYFLKHQRSPEEKEEQSQRWLEALKAQVGDA